MEKRYTPISKVVGIVVGTALVSCLVTVALIKATDGNQKGDRGYPSGISSYPNASNYGHNPADKRSRTRVYHASVPESSFPRPPLSPDKADDHAFKRYAEIAAASGDYTLLSKLFDNLGQDKREYYFQQAVSIFSPLGPAHDIREKLTLLEKVEAYASSLEGMRKSVFEREAVERYEAMRNEGVLKALSDEEFAAVCRRISINRVGKAFDAVEDAGSESAMRAAAAAVARSAIAGGTMAASKAIGELPAGVIRDEAIVELVVWLRQTNSKDEAAPWEALITDENARNRLATASAR